MSAMTTIRSSPRAVQCCSLHTVRSTGCTTVYGRRLPTTTRCRSTGEQAGHPVDETPSTLEQPAPVERPDDVLPDDLPDAISQAACSTALALQRGVDKCIAEILMTEFWDPASGAVFSESGDQQRFWKLTRRFVDDLLSNCNYERVTVVYPDMGVAAMLKNQWQDAGFAIGSLNDRKPFSSDVQLVVLAAPDPPGLDDVFRISRTLPDGAALVMFNPRLASGDVGIGLNVRRMRDRFLGAFTTTYSLRPIGDVGSVFRKYPDLWKVFVEDSQVQGRYRLIAEEVQRPAGEYLDVMIMDALGGPTTNADGSENAGQGALSQMGATFAGLQRFMRSLSR